MDHSLSIPFETLRTFGQMNVHLTHELQNVMATIAETSGLLEDLAAFSSSSQQVDPARLDKLLQRVVKEAERGQKLVGRINSLAHSLDEPVIRLDLVRLARFMAEVSACFPKARALDMDLPEEPAVMECAPYYVEQMLYGCLRAAFSGLDPEQRLELSLSPAGQGCLMRISGLAADPEADDGERFPDPATALAAKALGAEILLDRPAGSLEIRLARLVDMKA